MEHLFTPWRIDYIRSSKQQGCIFCDMLEAADPDNFILWRSAHSFLVLNRYPYNNGHLMSVPYRHVASLEDLTPDEVTDVMALTTLSLRAIRSSMSPEGFNIGVNIGRVAGAGVKDHVHVHVVPRWAGDTNFMPLFGDTRVIPQALEHTYAELRAALEQLAGE